MTDVAARLVSITREKSRLQGEVPDDLKKANMIPSFREVKEEDLGNNQVVCLTSAPEKFPGEHPLRIHL